MSRGQAVTMNSLISTSLLLNPEKKIKFKKIKQTCTALYNHIQERQQKCYVSTLPQYYDINLAALNLGFKVAGKPKDKR